MVPEQLGATWPWLEQGWSQPLPFPVLPRCGGQEGVGDESLGSKPNRLSPSEEPPVGKWLRLSCLSCVGVQRRNEPADFLQILPHPQSLRSLKAAMQCPLIWKTGPRTSGWSQWVLSRILSKGPLRTTLQFVRDTNVSMSLGCYLDEQNGNTSKKI